MTEAVSRSDLQIKRDQLEVLSIAEGFFQSSILFALLRLKVFECIDKWSKDLDEIAATVGVQSATLARLLNAGVVIKLLESDDGFHYRLSAASRSVLLPSAGENYLGNWIKNLEFFHLGLSKLDEAVRKSGPVVDPLIELGSDADTTREFVLAMHNYATLMGKELARFLNTSKCKTLLDLCCGPGTYSFYLGMNNANLELFLADLPGVLKVTSEVRRKYPLQNQVHYLPLDVLNDDIPGTYDLILISNVLHMLGESASRKLLKRLYGSVNPGGSVVVQARYMQDNRLGPRWAVMLDLNQLCTTVEGKNHTLRETRGWLIEAGFAEIEFCRMTLLNNNSFLRGHKV
jgi:SAM-dependent methyltransferase